jgi:hypothetical protein
MKSLAIALLLSFSATASLPEVTEAPVQPDVRHGDYFTGDPYTDCWLECRHQDDGELYQSCYNSCLRRKLR